MLADRHEKPPWAACTRGMNHSGSGGRRSALSSSCHVVSVLPWLSTGEGDGPPLFIQ